MKMTLETNLKWLIGLTILTLIAPFIYMKIGPLGYEFYGPDVPDVYILGATILGKDRSDLGINLAYKFQLVMILIYLSLTVLTYFKLRKGRPVLYPLVVNLTLLILFPLWIMMYIQNVINNSDGADLSTYPHVGILIYLIISALNILAIVKMIRKLRMQ